MPLLFKNGRFLLPDGIRVNDSLLVDKGRIGTWNGKKKPATGTKTIDCKGCWVAPGFIDLHIHGALGRDTMEATAEAWNVISLFHLMGGTTRLALTTVAATPAELGRVLTLAASKPELEGASLLGIHVEGPFLNPEKRGAHRTTCLAHPTAKNLAPILKHKKSVTQVTLAPELPHGLAALRALQKAGIVPSAGHTNANAVQLNQAHKAGLDHATHLFNCMASAQKNGPLRNAGALEAILASPEITAEIIADGFHADPDLLRLAWRAKGRDGLILITDATAGAGLRPGSIFNVGTDLEARVMKGHALTLDGSTLAGSTCTMIEGIATLVQQAGLSLADAVRLATYNPARRIGREKEFGSLREGLQADFVLFDDRFKVRQVWMAGERVL